MEGGEKNKNKGRQKKEEIIREVKKSENNILREE